MNAFSDIDPAAMVDTRIQLHWASQILGAAADATLEKRKDDSHSNLAWDSASKALENRGGSSIDVLNFRLIHEGCSMELCGSSLEEGMSWLGDQLSQRLTPRAYDMPDHDVAHGAPFQPDSDHLRAIADWFTLGQSALLQHGELRVWPHHFDLGFLTSEIGTGKSIGGGFSPGDDHYSVPYLYINPYGIDQPAELPPLKTGFWTGKWLGAVITANELNRPDAIVIARGFAENAMTVCNALLRE